LPLTIETNFSLKIPGLTHQESTLEESLPPHAKLGFCG